MNNENTPSPDDILQAVTREESRKRKGRLKIFLGMAAGVGKTHDMLEEAQKLKRDGLDVYIGIVDAHGRKETAILTEGLKAFPEKKISYKGAVFSELYLEKILEERPQLVLVDELAHSNIPGSRHPKRWQDVVELLENGIDVYTTLNVQHIESLKEVVERITGIAIKETVPDLIIETATFIELVDITPDELLERLREGKVYLADQPEIYTKNFFQEDRLTALRELALRYSADKVDHDLHGMVSTVQRSMGWKPHEKLLVAISANSHSQKLIRTTRRFAFMLDATWVAVHVDDGQLLSEDDQTMLDKNIALARDLGAEVITTNDNDVAAAIQRIAQQKEVTQIIIGRLPRSSWFDCFRRSSLLDRLARECIGVDIHVIRQQAPFTPSRKIMAKFTFQKKISSYLFMISFVVLFSAINWLLFPWMGYRIVGSLFLLSILFLSLFCKKGPLILSAILYAFIWDYFFVPPIEHFVMGTTEDNAILILYLLTAITTGVLTTRARENKEMLIKREKTAQALYEIVQIIAMAPTSKQILESVKKKLETVLNGTCHILIKQIDNGINFKEHPFLSNDSKEKNAALWVFENGKEAGWSTSTLPSAQNLYIPLIGFSQVVGILVYRSKTNRNPTLEEKNFLYTVGKQLAHFFERSFSEERERQLEKLNEKEKIYQTILTLLYQELKRPLSGMQDSLKELKGVIGQTAEEPIKKMDLSTERLLRLFNNISSMAELSIGALPIEKKPNDIYELIKSCCNKIKKSINGHKLKVSIQENLPLILFDFILIERLLHNLVVNAFKYSPADSTIEVVVIMTDDYLIISVLDEGKGIPPDELDTIFEKFYRLPGASAPGIGLGLAIAKAIAEIHQGYLKAENRATGGAKFSFFLPIAPRNSP